MKNEMNFCRGGGCTAKLGAGALSRVLGMLPRGPVDENLLIGYDSKDDAAVYRISDDVAIVQTLDFFPPMVDDPYLFGQIAATNALSDVFAMGGEVKTALNIVCFPEEMSLNVLGEILRGGSEKVIEAGGTLAGGHSIADDSVKYGLSVTGVVHPNRIYANNRALSGDLLVLTKKLGVCIICAANRIGEASEAAMGEAIASMTTLNKPLMQDVLAYADEFYLTAAAQRNRNHVEPHVRFRGVSFAMEEALFDPQTSGGLLIAVDARDAQGMVGRMRQEGLPAAIVGEITPKGETEIIVEQEQA